jgi:endonuclease/exonuclease/phosphatase family metal-dependent hydrolase
MRPLILLFLLTARALFGVELTCVTWNMCWFPSGEKNLRLPDVEPGRIAKAAEILGNALPDILFLQEIRDQESCEALALAMGNGARVATCSSFTDESRIPSYQQCAILIRNSARITELQIVSAGFERWKRKGRLVPARGYAYAVFKAGQTTVACYCLHLKANRSNTFKGQQQDIYNREEAIKQLMVATKEHPADKIVIAGDFNTNLDDAAWVSEASLRHLDETGYAYCFQGVPMSRRVTIPAQKGYPDVTFDHIFFKGFHMKSPGRIVSGVPISDHNAVVVTLLDE